MSASVCRECSAAIRFIRLDTGKALPIDPVPHPSGNVAAQPLSKTRWHGYVISRAKPLRDGYQLFMPHHATCQRAGKPGPRPQALFDKEPK